MSLYCTIKNQLKEDFWKIVNRKETSSPNFEFLVLNEFLGLKTVNLITVVTLAMDLRKEYNLTIQEIYDYIEKGCTDILSMIEKVKKDLIKRISPTLRIINSIKNGESDE